MNKPIRQKITNIYEPNRDIRPGLIKSFVLMAGELKSGYELGMRLFRRDFVAKYRQTLFGFLWAVLWPLFSVALFLALNLSGVLNVGDIGIPYVVYALFGMTLWNLFTGMATGISGVLGTTGGLISKINFTRISLVFSPILTAVIDFGIRMVLLAVVMIFTGTTPNWMGAAVYFMAIIPLILLAIGLGLFFTVIGAVAKDFPNILTMFFNLIMFISPVVYPTTNRGGIVGALALYNPLTVLLDGPRNLFFYGAFVDLRNFSYILAIVLVVFLSGWRFYQVAINRIVEKI